MDQASSHLNGSRGSDEIHLRDIWNLLVRNWLLIGACLVGVVSTTAVFTFLAIPVYESSTSIRIDEEQSNVPVLDILQTISSGSQVETEMEVLRSRTLAETVVDSLALQVRILEPRGTARTEVLADVHAERWAPRAVYDLERRADGRFQATNEDTGEAAGAFSVGGTAALRGVAFSLRPAAAELDRIRIGVRSFEEAVAGLREALVVARPNREAALVTVRYQSADTQLVRLVPNVLADQFIARRRDVQKTEARSTVQFLLVQLDTISGQLREAEQALQAFREGQQVVSLQAEANAQVTQLAALQAERNQKDAERAALQSLLDEIRSEDASSDPDDPSPYRRLLGFPSLLRNQAASELLRSLNEAEAPLQDLLSRRTLEDPDVVATTTRVRELESQLRSIATTYLDGLTREVESLDATLRRFGIELERIPAKELQSARLERQAKILEEVFTLLQSRLKEAEIAQAVEDASVRVVDAAILPTEPIKPRKKLNLALAVLLGGVLGIGAAFMRDYLDDTVHTREDVTRATGGAPVLGLIPRIREAGGANGRKGAGVAATDGVEHLGARLVTGRDPRNPVSEAYRTLRTNISFANPDSPPRVLVFTSPLPQEGKSTSAANLAITLAQQGRRAILIDADLRRGVLNTVFGTPREPGLSNLLAGQNTADAVLQEIQLGESGSLAFISTGTLPPNPAEILGSVRMRELLRALQERYEAVILDSAPLNVVTDAAVLGTNADGVILVARASSTEKGALAYAVDQLKAVRAPILGAVLNDVDFKRDGRYSSSYGKYGYYYQYYYGNRKT